MDNQRFSATPAIDYAQRLTCVQNALASAKVDCMFISFSANLHYLTGIERGEPNYGNTRYPGQWLAGAWVPQQGFPVLTLPRMLADFHLGDLAGYDVRVLPDAGDPVALASSVLASLKLGQARQILVEDRAWAETLLCLQGLLPQASFAPASRVMAPLRRTKDPAEIAILRKAGEITEAAYTAARAKLQHGMTNLDLITEVNFQLRSHGAQTHSFVTSFYNMGPAYPYDFTNQEQVLLMPLLPPVTISYDFGAVYAGYCYDFGRSVFFGEPDAEYQRVYELILSAQQAGIAALRVGNCCEAVDAAARSVIDVAGYGHAFRHRLGHGIGMDVHEAPFLTAGDTTELEPGMCFTVEPSVFLPHRFGARIEDVVVVGKEGSEALTGGCRELHVVA